MKDTKVKKWWRIFKASKFIESNYIEDKKSIIAKYNEVGYRDARIIKDTTYLNKDNTLSIEITIEEGFCPKDTNFLNSLALSKYVLDCHFLYRVTKNSGSGVSCLIIKYLFF